MPSLVAIPWQRNFYLTPETLSMLQLASAHAGHNIPVSDAWRSYAEQAYYYDQYLHHGGPVASNPDTGQRNHMRGDAVDIQNRADRAAMLAVGFTPDPDEWWHFNNPRWASHPIIPTLTIPASPGASTPIGKDDDDMQIWEAFKVVPAQGAPRDDTIYLSLNRAGYWGQTAQDWADRQYWFNQHGIPVPQVQSVKNPSAFGPNLSQR